MASDSRTTAAAHANRLHWAPVFFPVIVAVALTALLVLYVYSMERDAAVDNYTRQRDTIYGELVKSLRAPPEVVHNLALLYQSSNEVVEREFATFADGLREEHKEIEMLQWVEQIEPDGLDAFLGELDTHAQREVREWSSDGTWKRVGPPGKTRQLVKFVYPPEGHEENYGRDQGSHPERRRALELARDRGIAVATTPFPLDDNPLNNGFLIFWPIYHPNGNTDDETGRRAAYWGAVVGVFRMRDLVDSSFAAYRDRGWRLSIRDVTDTAPRIVYGNDAGAGDSTEDFGPRKDFLIEIAQRQWLATLALADPTAIQLRTWPVWLAGAMGLLLSALVGSLLTVVHQRAGRVASLVEQRTESLRHTQEQLELALTYGNVGLWDWDIATSRVFFSSQFKAQLGLDPDVPMDNYMDWEARLHPDDKAEAVRRVQDYFEGRLPEYISTFRLQHEDGTFVWILSQGELLRDDHGHPRRMIGVHVDITAQKQLELQLRESEERFRHLANQLQETNRELQHRSQEMEQFVYTVSHDLKSPLVTMKGFVGFLREGLAEGNPDEVTDSAARIEAAADRMQMLIDDLLQLSRVRRSEDRPERIDMAELLSDLELELRPRLAEVGARLEVQPDIPPIVADRQRMIQLFENLLSNAIKYGCEAPEPVIRVGGALTEGDRVHYFVADNGPGIEAEFHGRIFGLFQRVRTDRAGTGVGLAIVARIVQTYGGRVWVESAPGQGATFWISLPSEARVPVTRPWESSTVLGW